MPDHYCTCGRKLIFEYNADRSHYTPSAKCECGCVYILLFTREIKERVIKISDEKGIQK